MILGRIIRILIVCYTLQVPSIYGQDRRLSQRLLDRIGYLQVTHEGFYYPGMFGSFRIYDGPFAGPKPDNNIFFTALISLTLQQAEPGLSPEDRTRCELIASRAALAYPSFLNPLTRNSYNFWPTMPPEVFPGSWFIHLFRKKSELPDDLDDTDLIFASLKSRDSLARCVGYRMGRHANTRKGRIRNTFRRYREIPAYSTWFGKKMPVDFDFCVLCNDLYFRRVYHLAEDRYDSASIRLLVDFIRNRDYIRRPAYISPHYARIPLLLYHIARLLGRFPVPALMQLKKPLIREARRQLAQAPDLMDSVILCTSLFHLGADPPRLNLPPGLPYSRIENSPFTFFIAGFYSILPNPLKGFCSGFGFLRYEYRCPAFNDALVLEYLSLRDLGSGAASQGGVPEGISDPTQ